MNSSSTNFELNDNNDLFYSPKNIISSLKFSDSMSNILISSSWDNVSKLYNLY